MKKIIMKAASAMALLAMSGCVCLAIIGCQTRVTWTKHPETAMPIQEVRQVNGVDQVLTVGYQMAGGGFEVTARSPLFAKETLNDFKAEVYTNGAFCASFGSYERDLSTNSIVMVRTIFDGSSNLAAAVAKAYATIQTGGATDATGAIVSKVVGFFKSKGGDSAKSTVSSDGSKLTVTDGTTTVQCDADGNCSYCTDGNCSLQ